MTQLITFDFFGVLCTPPYSNFMREVFPNNPEKLAQYRAIIDSDIDLGIKTEEDLINLFADDLSIPSAQVKEMIYKHISLNQELLDLIKQLKSKYKIGLLTNSPRSLIESALGGQISLFDVIAISSDARLIKPDPKFYNYFIEKAGIIAPDILFIDDREENVIGAQDVGITAVQYISNEQIVDLLRAQKILV